MRWAGMILGRARPPGAPRRSGTLRPTAGFTLIEILASVAVLMIIVMMMGRVYRDSVVAWNLGTRRAENNMASRAVMDFVMRDLSAAVVDSNLSFRHESEDFKVFSSPGVIKVQDWMNDTISFVSLSNDPQSGDRAAMQVTYFVTNMTEVVGGVTNSLPGRYVLKRAVQNGSGPLGLRCYQTNRWWMTGKLGAQPIAENIASFEVWCYGASNMGSSAVYTNVPDYNSGLVPSPSQYGNWPELAGYQAYKAPAWVEVYFSMLEADAAIKANELVEAGLAAGQETYFDRAKRLVEENEKRYLIRVYIGARNGCIGGR